jgi:hypothetical protein
MPRKRLRSRSAARVVRASEVRFSYCGSKGGAVRHGAACCGKVRRMQPWPSGGPAASPHGGNWRHLWAGGRAQRSTHRNRSPEAAGAARPQSPQLLGPPTTASNNGRAQCQGWRACRMCSCSGGKLSTQARRRGPYRRLPSSAPAAGWAGGRGVLRYSAVLSRREGGGRGWAAAAAGWSWAMPLRGVQHADGRCRTRRAS